MLSRAARATEGALPRCVWMFSTSTVDMSTRMPTARARPPSVIRLMVWPVSHRRKQRGQQGDGDVQDHHDHGAPIAQEQEHHQPGEDGPQHALSAHLLDRLGHVGRLIELEAHVDILGQDGLHSGQGRLHLIDHGQGRGIGPLGDQHEDGPPAVHQGVPGGDVGAVFDLGDVAEVDVLTQAGAGCSPVLRTARTMELTGTIGIWSLMRALPEGLIELPAFRAATTSSGDRLYERRRSGSTCTTRVR